MEQALCARCCMDKKISQPLGDAGGMELEPDGGLQGNKGTALIRHVSCDFCALAALAVSSVYPLTQSSRVCFGKAPGALHLPLSPHYLLSERWILVWGDTSEHYGRRASPLLSSGLVVGSHNGGFPRCLCF